MAGGKETPRQKMIGMMYLVLTALLALQVSAAIIQKFVFLDNSLSQVKVKENIANDELRTRIAVTVRQEGNKDKAIAEQAAQIRTKTGELISFMDGLREELITKTGGMQEGSYVGGKEEEKVINIMVGPEGTTKGKGYELEKKLDVYRTYLNGLGVEVPNLAASGKEDPLFKKDPDQNTKDFAHLNFAQTPMVAALAVLSQKQTEVLKYENDALNLLASKVGAADLKFDNVFAMVRPESKYVAAGTKYEADMFLTASSSAITPTMTARGAALKVDPVTKMGKVSFTVHPASSYDSEGKAKATWKGAINFKFKGKDTTFPISTEYYIVRPVIQVQSASVQALYRNCGNELSIQVPALGSAYNPSFSATNSQVYKNAKKKGYVTIVPSKTAREVAISVSSNGTAIGTEKFKVKGIPRPTIEARIGTRVANEKQGEPAPGPRSLTMAAVAEENFQAFLPKDAHYRVSKWECILVRGKRPVDTKKVSGPTVNLASFASRAKPSDRILIDIKEVQRRNYKGDVEIVDVGTVIKNIPLY